MWLCQCECRNFLALSENDFVRGRHTSCGCRQGTPLPGVYAVGGMYGNVELVYFAGRFDLAGEPRWIVRCECGWYFEVSDKRLLQTGLLKFCGTENCLTMRSNLTYKQRYGMLTGVSPTGKKTLHPVSAEWLFACDCGGNIKAPAHLVAESQITSCGCVSLPNMPVLEYWVERDNGNEDSRTVGGKCREGLVARRFDHLRVIAPVPNRNRPVLAMYLCKCDCDNWAIVSEHALLNRKRKSCGCRDARPAAIVVSPHTRYGSLELISFTGEINGAGETMWLCKCDCQRFIEAPLWNLRRGKRHTCGCKTKGPDSRNFHDISGETFGCLRAICPTGEKQSNNVTVWLCECVCFGYTRVPISSLTTGHTQSCGCLAGRPARWSEPVRIENA